MESHFFQASKGSTKYVYHIFAFLHLPAASHYMYVFHFRNKLLRNVSEGENIITFSIIFQYVASKAFIAITNTVCLTCKILHISEKTLF